MVSCGTIAGLLLTAFLGASAYVYSPTRYNPPAFDSTDYREKQIETWTIYQTARMDSYIFCKDEEGKRLCAEISNICLEHLKRQNLVPIVSQMNDDLFECFVRLSRFLFSQQEFIEFSEPIDFVEEGRVLAFVKGLITKSASLPHKTFRVDVATIKDVIDFEDFETAVQNYRLNNSKWNDEQAFALGAAYLALRNDEYQDREVTEEKVRNLLSKWSMNK